jgi:hypothetical protein
MHKRRHNHLFHSKAGRNQPFIDRIQQKSPLFSPGHSTGFAPKISVSLAVNDINVGARIPRPNSSARHPNVDRFVGVAANHPGAEYAPLRLDLNRSA